MLYVRLSAENDNNGNPRRCYVVMDDEGKAIEVIDEGYEGRSIVTGKYPGAQEGPTIHVKVGEYREWIAFQREKDKQEKLRQKRLIAQRNKANGLLNDLLREARRIASGHTPQRELHDTIRDLTIHMADGLEGPEWREILALHMREMAEARHQR